MAAADKIAKIIEILNNFRGGSSAGQKEQATDGVVGSFGSFVFLRKHGLSNFSMQSTLATEPQDQTGSKPSTIVDGPDLQSVQFDLKLSRALAVDPDAVVKDLQSLLNAQRPKKLVIGGEALGSYRWLLKSVSVTDAIRSGAGDIIFCSVSLSFEEFVRYGEREDTSTASSSSSPGVASSSGYGGSGSSTSASTASGSNAEEKAEEKRTIYSPYGLPIAGKIPDAADLKRGLEAMKESNVAVKVQMGMATTAEAYDFFEKRDQTMVAGAVGAAKAGAALVTK